MHTYMCVTYRNVYKGHIILILSMHISIYDCWTKRGLGSVATSTAISCRLIGWVDVFRSFCRKKPSNFREINHELTFYLKKFCEKAMNFSKINLQSNNPSLEKFAKKILNFHKINPSSGSSLMILIKSNYKPFHLLLLHEQHYMHPLNTKIYWN